MAATTNIARDSETRTTGSPDEAFRAANRAAIAHARGTPDLGRWRPYGQDEAHDDAVRRFRWDPAVRAYLDGKDARRRNRKADDWHPTAEQALLSGAAEFLEGEFTVKLVAWQEGTAILAENGLGDAERAVFRQVIAASAEEDVMGGTRPLATYRTLADAAYKDLGREIPPCRVWRICEKLAALGVFRKSDTKRERAHTETRSRNRPTIFDLRTPRVLAALAALPPVKQAPPALEGLVSADFPRWSEATREAVHESIRRQRRWDHDVPWEPLWELEARRASPHGGRDQAAMAAMYALLDLEPPPLAA